MSRTDNPRSQERYSLVDGQYVLSFGSARVMATKFVAVLVDTKLRLLITHGDPVSVRRELDEMRQISLSVGTAHYAQDWLLLEGRPQLDALNDALQGVVDLEALKDGFSNDDEIAAWEIARQLFARLRRQQ